MSNPTVASPTQNTDRSCLPFRGVENNTSAYLALDPSLREIRCVAILPGSENDCITCELMHTSLEDAATSMSYTALSYCWGDIDDTVSIQLRCPLTKDILTSAHDQASPTSQSITIPYRVTRNLHTALVALQRADHISDVKTQVFWIDALCINQSDPMEKTHQVGFMGKVFSSAESVFVWLGPEDIYSRVLCRTFKVHLGPLLQHFPNIWARSDSQFSSTEWKHFAGSLIQSLRLDKDLTRLICDVVQEFGFLRWQDGHLDASQYWYAFLRCFDRLLARPWWQRIWVLQEVVLAPRDDRGLFKVNIWTGEHALRWSEVGEIMRTIDALRGLAASPDFVHFGHAESDFSNFKWFRNSWWTPTLAMERNQTLPTILDLMERTRHFKTTDPWDRFFALLHIASDTAEVFRDEPLISPDYTKSIDAVINDYVNWQEQQESCLKIALNANNMVPFVKGPQLRSWDPQDRHGASKQDTGEPMLSLPLRGALYRCLTREGRKLGKIVAPISGEIRLSQETGSLEIPMGNTAPYHLYIAMSCSSHLDFYAKPAIEYGFMQMFGMLSPPPRPMASTVKNTDWQSGNPSVFHQSFWRFKRQRLFSTDDGNMVLSHVDVLPGDYIVMVNQVTTPFILRPTEEGKYRIVSQCSALERYKEEQGVYDQAFELVD